MKVNASSAACLEAAAVATHAQAEALHALALLPGAVRLFSGAADAISAWRLYKIGRILHKASTAFASIPCSSCTILATCEESEILEANMRSCLRSVDRLLTRVESVSFSGWFLRTASRRVAGISGELADLVEDFSYVRTVGLASAEAAAEADRANGQLRPLREYLSH